MDEMEFYEYFTLVFLCCVGIEVELSQGFITFNIGSSTYIQSLI
jgi:hypothetical protein